MPPPLLTVAVVGVSGHAKGPEGVGKSLLCNRFVRSSFDDFHAEHSSVLSQADFFGSPVINSDHWLFWGERDLQCGDLLPIKIRVIEQTEFVDDVQFEAIAEFSTEPYVTRATKLSIESKGKLMYLQKEQLGQEADFPQVRLTEEKISIDAFVFVFDVSNCVNRDLNLHLKFARNILEKLKKTRKSISIAATKFDALNKDIYRMLGECVHASKVNAPIIQTSAMYNVNIDAVFHKIVEDILKPKNKLTIRMFPEASKDREIELSRIKKTYADLLSNIKAIGIQKRSWTMLYQDFKFREHPTLLKFIELYGIATAKKYCDLSNTSPLDADYENIPQFELTKFPALFRALLRKSFSFLISSDELEILDWFEARCHIRTHPLFSYFYYDNVACLKNFPSLACLEQDSNGNVRIPTVLLWHPDAETVYKMYQEDVAKIHRDMKHCAISDYGSCSSYQRYSCSPTEHEYEPVEEQQFAQGLSRRDSMRSTDRAKSAQCPSKFRGSASSDFPVRSPSSSTQFAEFAEIQSRRPRRATGGMETGAAYGFQSNPNSPSPKLKMDKNGRTALGIRRRAPPTPRLLFLQHQNAETNTAPLATPEFVDVSPIYSTVQDAHEFPTASRSLSPDTPTTFERSRGKNWAPNSRNRRPQTATRTTTPCVPSSISSSPASSSTDKTPSSNHSSASQAAIMNSASEESLLQDQKKKRRDENNTFFGTPGGLIRKITSSFRRVTRSQDSVAFKSSRDSSLAPSRNVDTEAVVRLSGEAETIPAFIIRAVNFIEMSNGLSKEGLYRVSCSSTHLAEVDRQLRSTDNLDFSELDDSVVHVVGTALKRFLLKLQEPVVPSRFQSHFLQAVSSDTGEIKERLISALASLPKQNRSVLCYLLIHLKKVANTPESFMDVTNLSKVWFPTIFRPDYETMDEMALNVKNLQRIVEALLAHTPEICARVVELQQNNNIT